MAKIKLLRPRRITAQPSSSLSMAVKVACILLLAQAGATAQGLLEQPVNLRVKDATVPEALAQLSRQNDVKLAYSEHFFPKKNRVTVKARKQPVGEVLEVVLDGTGVGLREVGGQIVLYLLPVEEFQHMTLSGFVEDAETGERLIAAAVYCPELGQGTVTNDYGFYSLTLPSKANRLCFSYIGYNEKSVTLARQKDQRINQAIKPSLMLSEIVVTPTDTTPGNLLPSPSSMQRFKPDDFRAAPDLGGQSDLLRVMQMLPGLQTGADGMDGIFVRGGNSDQNLVLMDGAPVYNSDHLMGLFSIFNTSAVRSVKLLKGGFPARYGGRISSVVDVYTKEGNQNKWGGEVGVDLIGYKASIEGPLWRKKGSLIVSKRRSHFDFYLKPVATKLMSMGDLDDTDYRFKDWNIKLNYDFSERDRLYISYYKGKDLFSGTEYIQYDENNSDESTYNLDWGNTITSFRWNHVFGPKLFANTSLTYSKYKFGLGLLTRIVSSWEDPEGGISYSTIFLGIRSKNRDFALKTDFDYTPTAHHYLRFGASVVDHRLIPTAFSATATTENGMPVDSLELEDYFDLLEPIERKATSFDAYVEDEWRLGKRLSFNTGLRFSGFYTQGKTFVYPEPRLSAAYQLGKRAKLTASLTRTVQYLHRVDAFGVNIPINYWTPASPRLAPQRAWQGTVGLEGKLTKSIEFSLEGYYKTMQGLLAFPDSVLFDPEFGTDDPEESLISISGESRGLELLLRREEGRIGGWLGYGLSKSTRQSDGINDGRSFPYIFDRRHEVKAFAYYRFSSHWQASLNWCYGSPNPRIDETGFSLPAESGEMNSLRSTAYHRLDLALSFTKKLKHTEHQVKASLYNAYGRKNTAFYTVQYDNDFDPYFKPVSLFGIMPGIYYGMRF